jgi:D-3-phosphoglycerate dehydrogenase
MINKNNIKLLNKNPILVNCSRGGIIDEDALINALKKNKISYAGIDVFENEPGINKNFAKLKNVILTPHFAGKTVESRKRMAIMLSKKIMTYYHGNRKTLKFVN